MTGYTKLFGSIVASTIWRETDSTRLVWITMLALANQYGVVEASVPGLADLARVSVPACRDALATLIAPDLDSRTKDREGRRIEEVDGGWHILNHAKYRNKMRSAERQEYDRQYKRQMRAKIKDVHSVSTNVHSVHQSPHCQPIAEAEAEAEAEGTGGAGGEAVAPPPPATPSPQPEPKKRAEPFRAPGLGEIQLLMAKSGLPESEAHMFMAHYESNGWRVGKNPMRDFKAAVVTWKLRYERDRSVSRKGPDRNEGTLNAGKASLYRGVGKVE